jgi:outer membrane protein assembly factor BamE (lipoprotein component of BamABCDE complex)
MIWLQILLVLGLLFTGCDQVLYPRFEKSMWSSYIQLQDVRLGMSMAEVESIMGLPAIREEGDYRGGHYVFWFYLTHSMDYEGGGTVRNGYTPLVFQRGRLEGIGRRAYKMAVERPEGGEAPDDPWKRIR